jgi:hypothetical protein
LKKVSSPTVILLISLGAWLVSACSLMAVEPVEALAEPTAIVDHTPSPVPTVTPIPATPTPSPIPTETPIPATPTPSLMEFAVQNDRLEVQVIKIEKPYQVHLSDDLIFFPGDGNMFLDLGIKVTNLTDANIPFHWSDIYLVNKYQTKWYPVWGAYEKTNLVIDPLSIAIRQFQVDPLVQPDARIYLGVNGYMRLIFRLPKDNYYYYFRFADLPLIEIDHIQ